MDEKDILRNIVDKNIDKRKTLRNVSIYRRLIRLNFSHILVSMTNY